MIKRKKTITHIIAVLSAFMVTGCAFHLTTAPEGGEEGPAPEEWLDVAYSMPVIHARMVTNCIVGTKDLEVPFSADMDSLDVNSLSHLSGRAAASLPNASLNKDYEVYTETVGDITTTYQFDPDGDKDSQWVKYSRAPAASPIRELLSKNALDGIAYGDPREDGLTVITARLRPESFPAILGGLFGENEVPGDITYVFAQDGSLKGISLEAEDCTIDDDSGSMQLTGLTLDISILPADNDKLSLDKKAKEALDTEIHGKLYPKMINDALSGESGNEDKEAEVVENND